MISYYELLGMIKEEKAPKKIRVHLTQSTSEIYEREDDIDGRFNLYYLYRTKTKNDEYKGYLTECYVESMMFDKNIEVLDEKKIPDETTVSEEQMLFNNLTTIDQEYVIRIMKMLQQPIDCLHSKGDE